MIFLHKNANSYVNYLNFEYDKFYFMLIVDLEEKNMSKSLVKRDEDYSKWYKVHRKC